MEDDVTDRLIHLEKEVRNLYRLIEFWNGKVPLKYRKAFPKEDENPYFKADPFEKVTPDAFPLGFRGIETLEKIFIPKDPKILKAALKRMKGRAKIASREAKKNKKKTPPNV